MTLDLAKLRAETLALIDGTTPRPWRVMSRYSFISHKYSEQVVWEVPNSISLDLVADCGGATLTDRQNARLLAAAPTLAADTLRLLDEIERLTAENNKLRDDMSGGSFYQEDDIDAMQNEIERLRGALQKTILINARQQNGALYPDDLRGWMMAFDDAVDLIRAALAEGGPDDR